MFMRMIFDEKLAQAAYLFGCQQTGEAIVIDPERDVDRYIALAEENGLRIVAVAETHIHADFVSGARELAEKIDAMVYVSGEGGAEWQSQWLDSKLGGGSYAHKRLRDGDAFHIGKIEFRALHTPGHTPEHLAYLVTDHGSGASEPIGLVSGDFVFVGDLGRPDLLETAAGQAGNMEPSARQLFKTVHRLDDLADFLQVWPAHGAGSACGKALGAVPMSTIGYEKRFNPAIKAAVDERRFLDFILSGQPEPPLYFANMKRDNKEGPKVLGELPRPERVSVDTLAGITREDAVIIDTREWGEFRAAHIPGSLSFPLIKTFNTDAGSMVRDTDEIYLVIDESDRDEAVRDLIRIGLDRIKGWCAADEVGSAQQRGITLATIDEVGVEEAVKLVETKRVNVLDVRRATEFAGGHLPGATNITHTRLASRMSEVPRGAKVLVNCLTGVRSCRASAYLKKAGIDPINLRGGIAAWEEAAAEVTV